MRITIQLVEAPIDVSETYRALDDHGSGAVVLFCGRVRDTNDGKVVTAIDYTTYPAMVTAECARIWNEAAAWYPLHRGIIVHRIGRLPVGTISLVAGVAAPHREEAFAGARYLIEALKERVPIWKQES